MMSEHKEVTGIIDKQKMSSEPFSFLLRIFSHQVWETRMVLPVVPGYSEPQPFLQTSKYGELEVM